MTDLNTIAHNYITAWNESDAARRKALLEAAFTSDVSYRDPVMQGDGHDGIAALIDGVQQRFAGFRFSLKGQPDGFADRIRSGLPAISPLRGEIDRHNGLRQLPTPNEKRQSRSCQSPPLRAGQSHMELPSLCNSLAVARHICGRSIAVLRRNRTENGPESNRELPASTIFSAPGQVPGKPRKSPYAIPLPCCGRGRIAPNCPSQFGWQSG